MQAFVTMFFKVFIQMLSNECQHKVNCNILTERNSCLVGHRELLHSAVTESNSISSFLRAIRLFDLICYRDKQIKDYTATRLSSLFLTTYEIMVNNCFEHLLHIDQTVQTITHLQNIKPVFYDFVLILVKIYNVILSKNLIHICYEVCFTHLLYKYKPSILALSIISIVTDITNLSDYVDIADYNKCCNDLLSVLSIIKSKRVPKLLIPIGAQIINQRRSTVYTHKNMIDKNFEKDKKIGAGSYGKVYTLLNNEKLVSKQFFCLSDFYNELIFNINLNHPNVAKVLGYREFDKVIYFKRGLSDLSRVKADKRQVRKYVRQLVRAVYYCHSNMISHGDIKPENVILFMNDHIKLVDFGNACIFNPYLISNIDNIGTYNYAPPEVFTDKHRGDLFKVDIWGIGMIMLHLITNGDFYRETPEITVDSMCICDTWQTFNSNIDAIEADFLSAVLKYDPDERLDIYKIMSHRYITQL